MQVSIAAFQFNVETGKVKDNIDKANKAFKLIQDKPIDFIALPELWATGFAYDKLKELAKDYHDEIIEFISGKAKKHKAYIISGSLAELKDEKVYNTSYIFNSQGEIAGKFSKIHLFQPTRESEYFQGGQEIDVIKTDKAVIGVMICYDLRFPEVARKLALDGAQIIFVPAQFPEPKEEHWTTLIKARALENQVFVVGINRIGGNNLKHFGATMLAGPNGKILNKLDNKEGILIHKINLKDIDAEQATIPTFSARRPEVYSTE